MKYKAEGAEGAERLTISGCVPEFYRQNVIVHFSKKATLRKLFLDISLVSVSCCTRRHQKRTSMPLFVAGEGDSDGGYSLVFP